jgi:hypothetical protein
MFLRLPCRDCLRPGDPHHLLTSLAAGFDRIQLMYARVRPLRMCAATG